uniref:Uncharacterized protein n=1 Tax=Monodon monoceros TaxID=40151 RepID=A0A8C6BM24_MONMO
VNVFLKIRRRKTIIFMEGKAASTMFLLKRIVKGILKQLPDEQRLYKDHRPCSATRSPRTATKSSPHSRQLEKTREQQRRPNAAKNKYFFKKRKSSL